MVRLRGQLILPEFRSVLIAPLFVVFRIVQNGSTLFAVEHHNVADVGTRLTFRYPFESIALELFPEGFEKVDLSAFTKLFIAFSFQLPLQIVDPVRKLLRFLERFGPLCVECFVFGLLHSFTLRFQVLLKFDSVLVRFARFGIGLGYGLFVSRHRIPQPQLRPLRRNLTYAFHFAGSIFFYLCDLQLKRSFIVLRGDTPGFRFVEFGPQSLLSFESGGFGSLNAVGGRRLGVSNGFVSNFDLAPFSLGLY